MRAALVVHAALGGIDLDHDRERTMSAAEQLNPIYTAACQFGMRGLRLVPVEHHTRTAILSEWQANASNDLSFIDKHWASGRNNIGLCCGPQPAGWNVLMIDVDIQNGGDRTLAALEAEYGKIDRSTLCFHRTPSGGVHLFFNVPPGMAVTGTNVLGPGIDARGGHEDNRGCGYGVLPPSEAPSKNPETMGEILPYGAGPGQGLLDRDPGPAPQWMLDKITEYLNPPKREIQASIDRHPSNNGSRLNEDDNPWNWIRDNVAWEDKLLQHRWSPCGGQYWTRPDKSPSEGHSAQLHDDGRLAIWTGEIPNEIVALGKRQVDGGVSISLADFITAYEFGGDRTAFGRYIRLEMMPKPPEFHVEHVEVLPDRLTVAPDEVVIQPQLTMEFWQAREQLEHIYRYAKAHRLSPEALLVHLFARYSAGVHPKWRLDMEGTLDFMGVVISPTGAFKTQAAKWVRHLYPGPMKKEVRYDLPAPSGEGIAESFMVTDPDNKGERKVGFQSAHFLVDEGKNLTAAGERLGSTVFPVLCSAWAGESIGNLNADKDKRRIIAPSEVRVSAVINIQKVNSQQMTSSFLTSIGFAGRMVFVMATDPQVPDVRPPSPGMLHLPNWSDAPTYSGTIEYPEIAWETIDQRALAVHRDQIAIDPRESQRTHQQGKIAGLLALMDARTSIVNDDWLLAGTVCDHSLATLRYLDAWHATTEGQVQTKKVREQVEHEAALGDERVIQRLIRWILGKVPPEGVTEGGLTRQQASEARPATIQALRRAVDIGLVVERNGRFYLP